MNIFSTDPSNSPMKPYYSLCLWNLHFSCAPHGFLAELLLRAAPKQYNLFLGDRVYGGCFTVRTNECLGSVGLTVMTSLLSPFHTQQNNLAEKTRITWKRFLAHVFCGCFLFFVLTYLLRSSDIPGTALIRTWHSYCHWDYRNFSVTIEIYGQSVCSLYLL